MNSTLHRILISWLEKQSNKIQEAFLVTEGKRLEFIVHQSQVQHDPALEGHLTELDLQIANDRVFKGLFFSVHAIPSVSEESLRAFVPRPTDPSVQKIWPV